MARIHRPERLQNATNFSRDEELSNHADLIAAMRQYAPEAWAALTDALTVKHIEGRPRAAGCYVSAFIAFTISKYFDIERFRITSTTADWLSWGFEAKPSKSTLHERFSELEGFAESIEEVVGKHLIQRAKRHDERVGRHIHVDSTEADTSAALIHDDAKCCAEGACVDQAVRSQQARRLSRMTAKDAQDERHRIDEEAPDELTDDDIEAVVEETNDLLSIKVSGHWYLSRDITAGGRAYVQKNGKAKFWFGFYNQKAICDFTRAPVAVGDYNARTQEYRIYPDMVERTIRAIGQKPESVIADRGFSVREVFEQNTKAGIASVMPPRKRHKTWRPRDLETHDRHGVPRCKHCGGETVFVRFRCDPYPCLWVKCATGTLSGVCAKEQRLSCATDWFSLTPLWQTSETYQELLASHSNMEGVHNDWRERYGVAPNTSSTRPARIGVAWQQIRSSFALFIEWFRICYREGWLGSARRNKGAAGRDEAIVGLGVRNLLQLMEERQALGLHLHYGSRAAALGLGPPEPPSEREAAKAPPNSAKS
jgi:hypothetical protein